MIAVSIAASACTIGGSETVEEVEPAVLNGLEEPTASTVATSSPETTAPESTAPPPPPASGDTEPSTTSTELSTTTTVATDDMTAYFIAGSGLIGTTVQVPEGAGLRERLRVALEGGPSEADIGRGARTALPGGLISGLDINGDVITVLLNSEPFSRVDPDDHRLMIGQIVLTLTAQPDGIDEVDFMLDDEPLPVYRRDNTQTAPGETVTADDYEVVVDEAERTASPTTAASDSTASSVSLTDGP